ncbi:MAG: DUF5696 domain-containing protein [Lachnospiraceae bacterium]|nr:DUF5696 domain-containing protein [Lachnospiraceae bacterium]
MKKYKVSLFAFMMALCLVFLGVCSSSSLAEETEAEAEAASDGSYWDTQEYDSLSGSDFVEVGTSGDMQLLVNPKTGTIRWLDTETGVYQDSNMAHDEGLSSLTNAEQSDVIVTYFSGTVTANKLYNTTTKYDSYSMCVDMKQLEYQLLDNGVRIVYYMGDTSITYKNFPLDITDERMQELVIQYLDEKQLATLKTSYYTQLSSGNWHRLFNTNDQNKLSSLAVSEIYNLFYEVGAYTDEELYTDLEANEADEDDYPSNLMIIIPVEYYLDDDGSLVVNVDTSLIETDEDNPINSLTLLPYFLTSSSEIDDEEDYMFIPDGSGALIYLDSTKNKEYSYSASYFTGDALISATTYSSVDTEMMLPVFGMKNSESTVFGIIENGAEIATLDAYVSGTDNSEPFSKMKLTFGIQSQQVVTSDSADAYYIYKASDDVYDGDITIRYYWLGEEATYVDMASCYSDYLEETGVLTEAEDEEDAPLYVELLGATDKTMYAAGIPYEGTQTLTTFSQAAEILSDLAGDGVSNMQVIYSGMVNDGMNQRSLAAGISLVSGLGGSSGLKSLISTAESLGATIYPNLQLTTVYTKKNLSNTAAAFNISNEKAQIYSFDLVTMEADTDADYPLYIISPNYLSTYLSKVSKSYDSKIGLTTLASSDLFSFIPTNYKGNQVSISTGREMLQASVSAVADEYDLMLSNPIVDGYSYASSVTDIPTTDSGMRVLDASVPFIQIVLSGHMTYSTESLNKESTDVYVNFIRAIETGSAPKFTFTYEESSLLSGTEQEDYFAVDYSYWKDKIGAYYEEYSEFYEMVKGATIVDHELYERNDDLRIVTWSNGVTVYINYSDLDETIDGVKVSASSYVIK